MEKNGIGVGEQALGGSCPASGVCLGGERGRICQVCIDDPVVAEEHKGMREGEVRCQRQEWLAKLPR